MAMSERQAEHLQSLTTALTGVADTAGTVCDRVTLDDDDFDALERARDIARRVLEGESYDRAEDAVRAEWAAAGGGPIEDDQ